MTALTLAILAAAFALLHVGATVDAKSLLIAATKTPPGTEEFEGLKDGMRYRGVMAGTSGIAAALLAILSLAALLADL